MKKLKPFLFGAIAGLLLMFVSLQFHLIRSEDGFRLVPRTPQPSLGLFYVDLRSWTPEDYADRPELARALVAHGDTDLVASSVTDRLLDGVSEDGSALDTLRGFMNEDGSLGGLEIPKEILPEDGSASGSDSLNEFPDLWNIPFNRDAKKPAVKQIAKADDVAAGSDPRTNQDRPSISPLFGPDNGGSQVADRPSDDRMAEPLDPFRETSTAPFSEPAASSQPPFTASEESDLISDMLFGDEDDVPVSDTGAASGWQDTIAKSRERLTDGVRSEVALRASEMASDFRGQLQDTRRQAFDQTLETIEDYSSRRIKESLPGPIGNFLNQGSSLTPLPSAGPGQPSTPNRIQNSLPPELEALQRGFDPFLK